MADENDADYDSVASMADRLGLSGTRRTKYIHEHMSGLGYKMQPTYVPGGDDDDDDDDDGLIPGNRRQRRPGGRRDDGDRQSRQRRSRGSDDWYS